MKMIYDRPVKELMKEFTSEKLKQGQIFSKAEAVDWFKQKYPKIRPTTVELHIEGMSTNNFERRKHRERILPGKGFDLFFKEGPGRFRLWNSETDPAPVYHFSKSEKGSLAIIANDADEEAENDALASEFAFEKDLRNYLVKNPESLEKGLKLYTDEEGEVNAVDFPAGGRYIDILAVNATGEYVVIELKVSRGYDRVIGQLLRYMEWVERNMADGKKVHGIIVASEITEDLKLAASRLPEVRLIEYELSFKLKTISAK